jgi:excisionase family DNA binding protein
MVATTTHAELDRLLVNSCEAARLLCISESTLKRLARGGSLPVVQIGRAVRFDPADLRAWISQQKMSECLA